MFNNLFKKFKKTINGGDNFYNESVDVDNTKIIELLEKIYSKQNKQSIVTDDIFETMEDKINVSEKLEEEIREYKEYENKLFELSITCVDSLNIIEKYINNTDNINHDLANQINLINRQINSQMSKCGIEKISKINENVDTCIHQIVDITENNDATKNATVKEVLVNGYIYKGKVVKKARIIANVHKEKII